MDSPQTQPRPAIPRAFLGAAFASGAAGLGYELVWVRQLSLALGATAPAVAWIFAAFFSGLTIGAYAGARLRFDPARARRAYAMAELAIALTGILTGSLFSMATASSAPWVPWLPAFLLPPTIVMGLTLPLLCRATDAGPRQASILYIVNTIGGALGVAGAGFLAFEFLGVRETLFLAAACNGIAALLVVGATPAVAGGGGPRSTTAGAGAVKIDKPLFLAFAVGLIAVSSEVVLNRLLYQVLGGTTYAITSTLCIYLLSMAAGSALTARSPFLDASRAPILGAALLLFGLTTALAPSVLDVSAGILRSVAATTELDAWNGFGLTGAVALAVLAPPAMASGLVFPLLVRSHGRAGAESLGLVYASNTLGAIAGSLLTTFFLVPRFGTTTVATTLGAAGALLAVVVLGNRGKLVSLTCAGILTVFGAYFAPRPAGLRLWLYEELSAEGELDDGPANGSTVNREVESTVVYLEGVNASAGVYERKRQGRAAIRDFAINGKKEASTDFEALRNQLVLGHLPMLLHPNPRSALIVGLGAGVTAGAVAVHPEIDVTIAELSPEVPVATREFSAANHGVLDRKNVKLVFEDGRRFLVKYIDAVNTGRARAFDVITSDPIHPWVSGAANLYTRDYFELVYRALAPNGVAAHWLPLYEMEVDESLAIFRGFAGAMPNCALWITFAGDAVLLGSKAPIHLDIAAFAERVSRGDVHADLSNIRLDDPLRLLAGLAAGPGLLVNTPGDVITDNHPVLEFRAARNLYKPNTVGPNLKYFAARTWDIDSLLAFLGAAASPARSRLAALLNANRTMTSAVGSVLDRSPDAVNLALEAWVTEPDGEQLTPLLRAPGLLERLKSPKTAAEALIAGASHARGARRDAPPNQVPEELRRALLTLESGLTLPGTDARVDRALRRQVAVLRGELKDYAGVLAALEPLLTAAEPDPTLLRIAAKALAKLGRDEDAQSALRRAEVVDFRK